MYSEHKRDQKEEMLKQEAEKEKATQNGKEKLALDNLAFNSNENTYKTDIKKSPIADRKENEKILGIDNKNFKLEDEELNKYNDVSKL